MNRPKSANKKLMSTMNEYAKVYCKCGHSMYVIPSRNFTYCSHCGRKVKNNTKGRFMYILLGEINGRKNQRRINSDNKRKR